MAKVRWLIENGDIYYFGQAPKHINGVALNADKIEFRNHGETFQLVARAVPQGSIEQTDFIWTSSNTSIATVSSNGLVTCVTPGSCTITVTTTYGGFTATCNVEKAPSFVDILLIGAGGGGGASTSSARPGGGGGAGGFVECFNYCVAAGAYQVTVGCYGGGGSSGCSGTSGGLSHFNGIYADGGGGGGGSQLPGVSVSGNSSGGGGGACRCPGGTSVLGYCGGTAGYCGGGGGGGASCNGCGAGTRAGGMGGDGKCSCITGICKWYAGGGGGGSYGTCSHGAGGQGCQTYGAGGGGGQNNNVGCAGYNGVFILRYPTACGYNITGGSCCYECDGYCIHCFLTDGTLTVN